MRCGSGVEEALANGAVGACVHLEDEVLLLVDHENRRGPRCARLAKRVDVLRETDVEAVERDLEK